jgi:hypothetical protein
MTMDCRQIEELMMEYLYQELDAAEMGQYKAHLGGCADCAGKLAGYERTRQAMRLLPELEPPQAVSARLLQEASARRAAVPALAAAGGGGEGFFGWLNAMVRPLMANPMLSTAAALVLVVGLAGLLYTKGVKEGGSYRAPSAAAELAKAEAENSKGMLDNAPTLAAAPEGTVAAPPATVPPADPQRGYYDDGQPERKGRLAAPDTNLMDPAAVGRGQQDRYDDGLGVDQGGGRRAGSGGGGATLGGATTITPEAEADGEEQNFESLDGKKTDMRTRDAEPRARPPAEEKAPSDKTLSKNEEGDAAKESPRAGAKSPPAKQPAPPPAGPARQEAKPQKPNDVTVDEDRDGADDSGAMAGGEAAPAQDAPAPTTASGGKDAESKQKKAAPAKTEADKQKEAKKLHGQARAKANSGDCAGALRIREKIYKVDPTYYDKRVRGDADLTRCDGSNKSRKKGGKQSADEMQQPSEPAQAPADSK